VLSLEEMLGQPLRRWLAGSFFEEHRKQYSRSRRKAPVYWQLATSSGSYSIWLHYHSLTPDSLFRLLTEIVAPKIGHEESSLALLEKEAGGTPSPTERRAIA